MVEANLLVRHYVIAMWVATAITLGLNIYTGLSGNLLLIGVGLGVALSYAIAGIILGTLAARTLGKYAGPEVR